ncbi:uncharacterized protein LOC119459587 [Dermacentor silvarum]|uniref:uncharacterized protein LOC119459587 n=1 Tax=Dermacentor silvarum TaxID=543639 RepID=UPI00189A3BFB|nr:uncharacterized protein LOC119459587 [Dermacentor silvarum]
MAAQVITIAILSMLQLGSAAKDSLMFVTARCDNAPDIDWTESINSYLRRIPATITMRGYMEDISITGFEFSTPKLTGLGSLWTYKPPHSYCTKNKTFTEVVVFADEPLHLSMGWKSCTGSSGTLGTTVSTSQMRIYFTAHPTPEGSYRLRLQHIRVDNLEDARLFLTGASPGIKTFVEALGVVGMPHLQLFWSRFLRVDGIMLMSDDL